MPSLFPIVLVVMSAVVYHLGQKAAAGQGSPWPMLAMAYGVAFALTLALAASDGALRLPTRSERGPALLVGLGALGIEAGFFFVYRAGWPLASAGVISNVAVTLILATIGLIAFGEQLTSGRVAGIALAALGAGLVVRG